MDRKTFLRRRQYSDQAKEALDDFISSRLKLITVEAAAVVHCDRNEPPNDVPSKKLSFEDWSIWYQGKENEYIRFSRKDYDWNTVYYSLPTEFLWSDEAVAKLNAEPERLQKIAEVKRKEQETKNKIKQEKAERTLLETLKAKYES